MRKLGSVCVMAAAMIASVITPAQAAESLVNPITDYSVTLSSQRRLDVSAR